MNLLGLDVSHDDFHAYDGDWTNHKRQPAAIKRWVESLPPDAVVGLEPTGRLHRAIVHALLDGNRTVYVLNPYKVKRYRDSSEFRVKTDKVDSRVARDYLRSALEPDKKPLHPYSNLKRAGEPLKDLLVYREGLIDHLASIRLSRSELANVSGLGLAGIEREHKKVVAELDKRIRDLASRDARYAKLLGIDGVGSVTAGVLSWLFSSHEFKSRHCAVSFAGMDLGIRESGKFRGKAKLTKQGPPIVRRCLYLAASSLRRIHAWKPYFERQQSKGRAKIEVNAMAARKLLKIAYAVWYQGVDYEREKAVRIN